MLSREQHLIEHQKKEKLRTMRQKLVHNPSKNQDQKVGSSPSKSIRASAWILPLLIIGASAAIAGLTLENREILGERLGFSQIKRLPSPDAQLSADEKALYWTYALYNRDEFIKRFGTGSPLVHTATAMQEIKNLFPVLSAETRQELTRYLGTKGL